tara:strand:+ start:772 stop:1050 length:279 start_codon:yes stop_codon:yes gene_type:complete
MINFSIHNVTEVLKARIQQSDHDSSGWITFNIAAQNYSWGDEDQETITNEITLFLKNKDLALAQLQDVITKAIAAHRREEVEKEGEMPDGSR